MCYSVVEKGELLSGHGNVTNLTDSSGAVVKTYSYDAFGVEQNPSDSDTNPFRYCGEYYDSEIEQIYLRARYYDPSLGRFTQSDPAMEDGYNWYVYCASNPILFIDPWGKKIGLPEYDSNGDERLEALQRLTDDTLEYNEDTGLVEIVSFSNEGEKEVGTNLIREIIENPYLCDIVYTEENNAYTVPSYYPDTGELAYVQIQYNPDINYDFLVETENGNRYEKGENYIVMGHELCHVYNRFIGNKDNIPDPSGDFENEYGHYRGGVYYYRDANREWQSEMQKIEETRTTGVVCYVACKDKQGRIVMNSVAPGIYNENALREENGLPRRVKY